MAFRRIMIVRATLPATEFTLYKTQDSRERKTSVHHQQLSWIIQPSIIYLFKRPSSFGNPVNFNYTWFQVDFVQFLVF